MAAAGGELHEEDGRAGDLGAALQVRVLHARHALHHPDALPAAALRRLDHQREAHLYWGEGEGDGPGRRTGEGAQPPSGGLCTVVLCRGVMGLSAAEARMAGAVGLVL